MGVWERRAVKTDKGELNKNVPQTVPPKYITGKAFRASDSQPIYVSKVRYIDTTITSVYNLAVANNHNYLVSAGKVLVHNDSRYLPTNRWITRDVFKQLGKYGKFRKSFVAAMKKGFAYTRYEDNGIIALSHKELEDYPGYNVKLKVAKAPGHFRVLGIMNAEKNTLIFDKIVFD